MSDLLGGASSDITSIEVGDATNFSIQRIESAGGLSISALPNGCIYSIECNGIQISQVLSSPVAGGIHRIYLRIHRGDRVSATEIVGPRATSVFEASPDRFVWSGAWEGLRYRCICRPSESGWLFHIELKNETAQLIRCDAVQVQDLGLGTAAQVRNNELFTSQYLDHLSFRHPDAGHLVMTRQNLPQPEDAHPWLLQGCLPMCRGFCTDGFDFFGLQYRDDAIPAGLLRAVIGYASRQYETAYMTLQSSDLKLKAAKSGELTFFARFVANHSEPSSSADADVSTLVESVREDLALILHKPAVPTPEARVESIFQSCGYFSADDFSRSEIESLFPGASQLEEAADDQLQSFFFGDDSTHVVLKAKELSVARPHGHIMRSGRGFTPEAELMSSAFYAAGVFASQLALGHSSMGKLFSGVRDPLNIIRSSGLRIFVRDPSASQWQLLCVPSAFEMSPHQCCWHYRRGEKLLTIRCLSAADDPTFTYQVEATSGPVELLIVGELSAGPSEYEHPMQVQVNAVTGRISVRPGSDSMLARKEPNISFHIVTPNPEVLAAASGDALLFPDRIARGLPYCAIQTRSTSAFTFTILGALRSAEKAESLCRRYEASASRGETQAVAARGFWKRLTGGIQIQLPSSASVLAIQNSLAWFARDAMVHLSTPRGLEQANGGAWGVRDVCQGPIEFLLSYGHLDAVADIIRTLFSRQYSSRCDWPQWFMFPPFHEIQSSHSHGDVLIWPLKALCDYLEHTNDASILREPLPYTDERTLTHTDRVETLLEHTDRLLDKMQSEFVCGLSLPRYGEGDWDDSLQPADPVLREKIVSSWTSELLYQTLRRFGTALSHFGLGERAARVRQLASEVAEDFQQFLVPDGVVAGFAVFAGVPAKPMEYLLHPSDSRTGLKYRLIPMTRGIISGVFSAKQAAAHMDLLHQHLVFPDGARLMDRPTVYTGGTERTFRRAESAAFFGREIGLQYVHAHLRYAEALAVMGRADDLLHALLVVNSIAVTQVVKNAQPRQRNCFFSSSDAAFADRYEASRDYDRLRSGDIATHGGWRVYSSGPGIYTNLVVRHLFGIRNYFDWVELDPVLPRELDRTRLQLHQNGRQVEYVYRVRNASCSPARITVNGIEVSSQMTASHPYRPGGVRIRKSDFEGLLTSPKNLVEIEL